MRIVVVILISIGWMNALQAQLVSDVQFQHCEASHITNAVADFATNRNEWKDYVNLISVSVSEESRKGGSGGTEYVALIAEDVGRKRVRRDLQATASLGAGLTNFPWASVVAEGNEVVHYFNGQASRQIIDGALFPMDCWNLAFVEQSSLFKGKCQPDLWQNVMVDKRLVASESNARLLRAEWKFGRTGRSRVQVYFDRSRVNVPVYAKYYIPRNPDKPFDDQFLLFKTEIRSEWVKISGKWIPRRIVSSRENYTEDGKFMGVRDIEFIISSHGPSSKHSDLFGEHPIASDVLAGRLFDERFKK